MVIEKNTISAKQFINKKSNYDRYMVKIIENTQLNKEIKDEDYVYSSGVHKNHKMFKINKWAIIRFYSGNEKLVTGIYQYIPVEKIYKKIEKEQPVFLDGCYLKNFSYSKDFYRTGKKLLNFSAKMAFFDGNVDFRDALFDKGQVSFVYTDFGQGDVDFSDASFEKNNVSFSGANLREGFTSFSYTNFQSGDIDFSNVDFGKGKVSFAEARFNKSKVNFKNATFDSGNIDFSRVDFGGSREIIFKNVSFGSGEVNFQLANFGGGSKVDFEGVEVEDIFFNNIENNNYWKLNFKKCEFLSLKNVTNRDVIDLHTDSINIKKISLVNLINSGIIKINFEIIDIKNMINNQEVANHLQRAYQFKILRENFNNLNQEKAAQKCNFEYKKHQLAASLENTDNWYSISKNNLIIQNILYPLRKIFLHLIGTTNRSIIIILLLIVLIIAYKLLI